MRAIDPGHHRADAMWAVGGALLAMLLFGPAQAASTGAKTSGGGAAGFLPGASSKDPVSIDAGKLDYFDKEQRLVYTGDVVAKQGETTLRGTVLTIFLAKDVKKAQPADQTAPPTPAAGAASPASGSSIKHMDVRGPVTIISKDEVGTGDNGSYDKADNKIVLVGNVTLTQATNIIKGDKLTYDMTSGQAQVTSGQTLGRVKSVFTPGSSTPGAAGKKQKGPAPAVKPDAAPAGK